MAISEIFFRENYQPIIFKIISSIYENYTHTRKTHTNLPIRLTQSKSHGPIQFLIQLTNWLACHLCQLELLPIGLWYFDVLLFRWVNSRNISFWNNSAWRQQKILVEIFCYKGDVRAMGTYFRDSALNSHYECSF